MDLKQIKELMASMEKEGIKKLSIKEKGGFELHMERQEDGSLTAMAPASHHYPHPLYQPFPPMHREHFPAAKAPEVEEKNEAKGAVVEGHFVNSPMVGTFYLSPSPDDPPFVKVGDQVDENTVVCIIEAMKVMNEVKAGKKGVIAEICQTNAHPVEFGTKLFRIT